MYASSVCCIFFSYGCISPKIYSVISKNLGITKIVLLTLGVWWLFCWKAIPTMTAPSFWSKVWMTGSGQRMWQGRVVSVIVWDAQMPSPLSGALPSSWISICALFALGLCLCKTKTHSGSVPTSDSRTFENYFWDRSQPSGLAEQPSQELPEDITAPFNGQTLLGLEWNTRTESRRVHVHEHVQHVLIANHPEARESSEGTVFKSLWTRPEPGRD